MRNFLLLLPLLIISCVNTDDELYNGQELLPPKDVIDNVLYYNDDLYIITTASATEDSMNPYLLDDKAYSSFHFYFKEEKVDTATHEIVSLYLNLLSEGEKGFREGIYTFKDEEEYPKFYIKDADFQLDTNQDGLLNEEDNIMKAQSGVVFIEKKGDDYIFNFNFNLDNGATLNGSYKNAFFKEQE